MENAKDIRAWVGVSIAEMEEALIRATLALKGVRRSQAAVILGISERSLYRKINEYVI